MRYILTTLLILVYAMILWFQIGTLRMVRFAVQERKRAGKTISFAERCADACPTIGLVALIGLLGFGFRRFGPIVMVVIGGIIWEGTAELAWRGSVWRGRMNDWSESEIGDPDHLDPQ